MPTVKTKGAKTRTFSYTPAGEKAAAGYAKATGGTLTKRKKKAKKKGAPKMPSFLGGM